MNPLTNVRNVKKLNEQDLHNGIFNHKLSWHSQYKDSAYIFIGGLPYELTEGDVLCVFSQYGEIVNINLVRDKKTGKSKGYCFLCYEDQRSTILAVDNFNDIKLGGRTIRVDHVSEYRTPKGDEKDDQGKYKDKIETGCAPKIPSPQSDDELLNRTDKKKKKKKDKNKKKKKKKTKDDGNTSGNNFHYKKEHKIEKTNKSEYHRETEKKCFGDNDEQTRDRDKVGKKPYSSNDSGKDKFKGDLDDESYRKSSQYKNSQNRNVNDHMVNERSRKLTRESGWDETGKHKSPAKDRSPERKRRHSRSRSRERGCKIK